MKRTKSGMCFAHVLIMYTNCRTEHTLPLQGEVTAVSKPESSLPVGLQRSTSDGLAVRCGSLSKM